MCPGVAGRWLGQRSNCAWIENKAGWMLTRGFMLEKPSWIPGTNVLPSVQALVALWEILLSLSGSWFLPARASDI